MKRIPYCTTTLLIFLLQAAPTMAQTEFVIDVRIDAPKETVWQALTNFPAYPSWNSMLYMTGNDQLAVGQNFHVTIHNGNKDSKFKAATLSKQAPDSFSARQKIVGKWLFSATHHFVLETPVGAPEQVVFVQKWELTGIVSKLFKKQIFKQLGLFNTMNSELKAHVEGQAQ